MGKAAVLAALLAGFAGSGSVAAPITWSTPQPVRIEGYDGEAMEPFVSRDGAFLFFNTRNDPGNDTDIHFAKRRDELTFVHQGVLAGTRSRDLDGVPTMARDGTFCFISPREYRQTLNSVYCGVFNGREVLHATPQTGLKTAQLGRLIFDVELSGDGTQMVFAEGTFSGGGAPDAAELHLAVRGADGYVRAADSERILASINALDGLKYAAGLSTDGLEIFFTHLTGFWIFRHVEIMRAERSTAQAPFGEPVRLPFDGFIEGPSLSGDGRALYFHKKVDEHFGIWRVVRP